MINTVTMITMLNDKNDDLSTPLVTKVPIEINASTTSKTRRRSSFSPKSVFGATVLVSEHDHDHHDDSIMAAVLFPDDHDHDDENYSTLV